ncbi:MAG: helix-hairpin-helix domain-containing protein [Phycisphaerales bacterium JB038]
MRGRQRATILLSVLVVVVIGTLIGTTMTMIAGAQRASVESAGMRAQSRALALSGLRAVVAELADQRRDLLRGDEPRLTPEWTLFEARDGRLGVVRLLPIGPESERFLSESAKLDLNSHSAETLARLPFADPTLAQRLASQAKAQPLSSLGGLLKLKGVTPEQLFGASGREESPVLGGEAGVDAVVFDTEFGAQAGPAVLGDLLTVFAFDPNVQTGLDSNRPEQFLGRRRINLNRDWSEQLDRAIRRRYEDDLADAVKAGMQGGLTFPSDERLIELLVGSGLEAEGWGAILDGFTAWREPYHYGKVDINRAAPEVLAALPGLDAAVAQDIVEVRRQLGDQHKRSPAWPVVEGIMTPEQFKEAGPWLATRSLQWRVRIEGGFRAGQPGGMQPVGLSPADLAPPSEADFAAGGYDEEVSDRLEQPVVLEAVIDLAGNVPRVAYLRDLSLYETAARVRTVALAAEAARAEAPADLPPADEFGDNGLTEADLADPMWPDASDSADTEDDDKPPTIGDDGGGRLSAGNDEDEADAEASPDNPPRRRSNRDRRIGRWRG